jgi:hypothetical protein
MKYIRTTKSKRLKKGKHMVYVGENKRTRSDLVGKTEGKRKLGRPKCEKENNNIQVELKDRLF